MNTIKNIAVLFNAPGNQPEEVIYPYYRLQEAEFDVKVVCSGEISKYKGRDVVIGKYGIPTPFTHRTDYLTSDEAKSAKIIICPGGWECPELLRNDEKVLTYLREMNAKNTIIAGCCHGPWVLISAGIVKGRRMTCYKGMKDDLANAGAIYEDAPVVVDGNLISSPHYNNNPDFMREILNVVK